MLLFNLDPDAKLAPAVAASLDEPLSRLEDRTFEDGECQLRPLVDPRGNDVYVLCSLHGTAQRSPHDQLCRLLMFIATLHEHGADRITAVLPYLAYARKDHQAQPYDPVTPRYLAQLIESVGTSQVIALEAHNIAAFQNAFRCRTVHLDGHRVFDTAVADWVGDGALAVAAPDPGSAHRALVWRDALAARLGRAVGFAVVDKRRTTGRPASLDLVSGEVGGMTVLALSDLIATGETLRRAAVALRHAGAREVIAVAAHGLFVTPAAQTLADPNLAIVAVSDSVPPWRLPANGPVAAKLRVVSAAPLLAQAIRTSHRGWLR